MNPGVSGRYPQWSRKARQLKWLQPTQMSTTLWHSLQLLISSWRRLRSKKNVPWTLSMLSMHALTTGCTCMFTFARSVAVVQTAQPTPWPNIASVQNASEHRAVLQVTLLVLLVVPLLLLRLQVPRPALMRLLANLKSGSPRLQSSQLFDFRTKPESSLRSLSLTPRMGQSFTVPWMPHYSKDSKFLKLCPQSGTSPTAA